MWRLTILSLAAAFMFGLAAHHPASGESSKASLPRLQPWRGDFDGMQQRRVLRLIVPYSTTLYFIDRGKQMGAAAEFGRELETWLNRRHACSHLNLHVMFAPTRPTSCLRRTTRASAAPSSPNSATWFWSAAQEPARRIWPSPSPAL
jgi:hypothetical protein